MEIITMGPDSAIHVPCWTILTIGQRGNNYLSTVYCNQTFVQPDQDGDGQKRRMEGCYLE